MHRIAAVVAGLSLAFVGTSTTIAATINVPGDHATIQGAIDASVNGDVIAIAAGTYYEANLNPNGKAITIGSASGNLDVTIDAQQGGSVFVINSGEGSGTVIQDLVITGGSGTVLGGPTCGGGVFCEFSNPTITDCRIEGNTASGGGGGIFCYNGSSATISSCVILDNAAGNRGGGIFCGYGSSPTITSSTISGNTAAEGGGVFCGNGSPTIGNVVVCGNEVDQIVNNYVDAGGNFVDEYCTIPEGACCSGNDCSITTSADCGGAWLGAGTACNDNTCFAGAIYVPNDYVTIQGAIDASVNGDVITIAAGTYYEANLNPGGKAITIQGTLNEDGSLATTIDAQQGGSVFEFYYDGEGAVIKDLVITGGIGADIGGGRRGGGIFCYNGSSPTITNCTISGNYAEYEGGGITCWNSNPTITDCRIDGNTADAGGGISCMVNSNPTISNCTISGNTAVGGGGILCSSSSPTISGCTIEGNTASYGGGIFVYNSSSNVTISSSIVCGNAPDQIVGSYTASGSCIEQSCDPCTADSDADGVPDLFDQCPGEDDTIDTDSDGTPDCIDGCPDDPLKTEPGDCGCGELDTDTDSDGTPDCIDGCPDDPLKTQPGICGCNVAETTVIGDLDCDGDYDIDDAYAAMANFGIETGSDCEGDANADGVVDVFDLLKVIDGWGICD